MESELVKLAVVYEAPGFLLLATDDDGERLGCVGLLNLGEADGVRTGEIRRLFVRDRGRGSGLGRLLVDRVISDARDSGFDRLVLNTVPAMTEAVALYKSLGFVACDPYVDEPLEDTFYMGLSLS